MSKPTYDELIEAHTACAIALVLCDNSHPDHIEISRDVWETAMEKIEMIDAKLYGE